MKEAPGSSETSALTRATRGVTTQKTPFFMGKMGEESSERDLKRIP
jgi:hypothetical protein